jgi:hypothetical protein
MPEAGRARPRGSHERDRIVRVGFAAIAGARACGDRLDQFPQRR